MNEEIYEILNTNPYQYSVFLMNDEQVEEKHKTLKKELENYQRHREELEAIASAFLAEGEVTVIWETD